MLAFRGPEVNRKMGAGYLAFWKIPLTCGGKPVILSGTFMTVVWCAHSQVAAMRPKATRSSLAAENQKTLDISLVRICPLRDVLLLSCVWLRGAWRPG